MASKVPWTFTFPQHSGSSSLENPIGYKALNDKALADEVAQALAQQKALSGKRDEVSADARRSARRMITAVEEKAWNLSWAPIKSLGMNLLMLYFGGAGAGIFTVLIISYAFLNAFKTLLSVNDQFQTLEDVLESKGGSSSPCSSRRSSLDAHALDADEVLARSQIHPLTKFFCSPFLKQKLVFVTICVAITSYIGYHAASLGIIPWRSGDFLDLIPEQKLVDRSVGIL